MNLNNLQFNYISGLIKEKSGIIIENDKQYLLETRLLPVAKQYNIKELPIFIDHIKTSQDNILINKVIEAMTTNESSFMRDIKVFKQIENDFMNNWLKLNPTKKSFKIWSAACSSGQEAYSIIMMFLENSKLANLDVEILATDISDSVLEKAKKGEFSQFEVQRGLPVTWLVKYFKSDATIWNIDNKIKSKVIFKKVNLLDDFTRIGIFDLILCRNVLIYFDLNTKINITSRLFKQMNSNAGLILGASERIYGDTQLTMLENCQGIYIKS